MLFYFSSLLSSIILSLFLPLASRAEVENYSTIPPVDITLLMIELKYDERQGIKICELQPVCHSSFDGCDYIYQQRGVIGHYICQYLSQFGDTFWFTNPDVSNNAMREQFLNHRWKSFHSLFEAIAKGDEGIEHSLQPPFDTHQLSDYSLILYAKIRSENEIQNLYSKFPGMVLIDKTFVPYMYDKYNQSLLFQGHPILEKIKPKWGIFPKQYSDHLVSDIKEKISTNKLVIKPLDANRGKGVIIVYKEDLSQTLKLIFYPEQNLANHPDRGYNYWLQDTSTHFLVEEFIETTPVLVEKENNFPFDVTYRLAVCLLYEKETIHLHYLGSYCNLSDKSLLVEGSLNEKHKTSLLTPQTMKTPLNTQKEIYRLLTQPLLILYKRILGFSPSSLEDGLETSIITESGLE